MAAIVKQRPDALAHAECEGTFIAARAITLAAAKK
jgi:hypothetical protein